MYYNARMRSDTIENDSYRKVLATTKTMQLVLMTLLPKQDIGSEVHPETTQYFFIEEGVGLAIVGSKNPMSHLLVKGVALIVPPNTRHNIINTSETKKLKLRTLYSPPEHPKGTHQKYKQS